ncbi:MAG TPA: DUF3857 domain-containing protein, partial [Acidobacteriaceae bacterium]|nr:DUF3857 domain-containing protein [Acidobacteriaceae bacterium]
YSIDAAGRVTQAHHLVYRIETAAGLDHWSEVSSEWETFFQNQPILRARVIRSDGSQLDLDPKTATDVAASDRNDGTLSDDRIYKAPLPGLAIGSIVEMETTNIDKEPFFADGGLYRIYLQRGVPITRSRVTVSLPASLPFTYKIHHLPDLITKDEKTGDLHNVTFDEGRLAPGVSSDIELATPSPLWPEIEFATGKSWHDIAAAYDRMVEPQIRLDQVRQLLPNKTPDRLARIQQLVARLHKEVRYTGIEFGRAKLEPRTPEEILSRHYGDCKDKATLLVAMLRATGIDAHLALLDTGPGMDVTPDLPGIGDFDHAIVFVPATANDPALWIDATAEFTRVGDLPWADQGRLALIVAGNTQDLTRTPDARPEDSSVIETREFHLADFGPAHVIESSDTAGHIDANFRAYYQDTENKNTRDNLENYVKSAYSAKDLKSIQHQDARDLNKPFLLRLDIEKAARGNTGMGDAAVGLDPRGTWNGLPAWFGKDPDRGNEKLSPEQQEAQRKAIAQRATDYQIEPFVCERRYRIFLPPGFVPRALPPDQTIPMGPASFSEKYASQPDGTVTAVFRFSTGSGRYSQDEALALRKAIVDAGKRDWPVLIFDQAGAKLLSQGKTREALAADRDLIAAHPHDAVQLARLARALVDSGAGQLARDEARKATQVDPSSAVAWDSLAWVLQYNDIGVFHGMGFDLDGALAAYRKAEELDPDNVETRENLAILDEHDNQGTRYVSIPGLEHAITEYRNLKAQNKAAGDAYEDNLLFCLLYAHHYKELKSELASLPASPTRNSLSIAGETASDGVDAGMKAADRLNGDAQQRGTALRNAGQQLIRLRLYPEAAKILAAGVQNQEQSSDTARQIEVYRDLHPRDLSQAAPSDPGTVVRQMMDALLSGHLTDDDIARMLSRHSFATDEQWKTNLKKMHQATNATFVVTERAGLTPDVLADLTLGNMKITAQGTDQTGYRVALQSIGAAPRLFFITKEEGVFRIVAGQSDMMEVGNQALFLLHAGNEAEARALLDWKRDQMHKGGGDDPLDGPLFPLFWTSGDSTGPDAIERAAAALMAAQMDISAMLPEIESKAKASSDKSKVDPSALNLLLAAGYLRAGKPNLAWPAIEALLRAYPDSVTAARLAGEYYRRVQNWAAWDAMLAPQVEKHPGNREWLLLKSYSQQSRGDWAAAQHTMRQVLDGGQATATDYNSYAWNALFESKPEDDALRAGQQTTAMSQNSDFASLHTLACLYAVLGKTREARQVLLQAMQAGSLAEPDPEVWFAMGLVYENDGLSDAAIAAYRRVEKPDAPLNPTDTWVLAQKHLQQLHAL